MSIQAKQLKGPAEVGTTAGKVGGILQLPGAQLNVPMLLVFALICLIPSALQMQAYFEG